MYLRLFKEHYYIADKQISTTIKVLQLNTHTLKTKSNWTDENEIGHEKKSAQS